MKSRFFAAILGMVGGIFGLHLFYLNRPGKGFMYLAFCWTLLPAIFGFIGGLRLLTMTDKAFENKYL